MDRYELQLNLHGTFHSRLSIRDLIEKRLVVSDMKHADGHTGPFTPCRARNKECVCLITTVAVMYTSRLSNLKMAAAYGSVINHDETHLQQFGRNLRDFI
jgi:hypothetical protein